MQKLELKIPPPLLMFISAGLMYGLYVLFPSVALPHLALKMPIIIACVLLGFSLALSGIWTFKKAKTTANPLKPNQASTLVISGVYRITRNPMYVGLLCILMGWAIYLNHLYVWAMPLLFALYITRFQIMPEEHALEKIFGDEFIHYKRSARRWL